MVCRFAHVYMQSGGPNRERLYRAGYSPPRAGGRAAGGPDDDIASYFFPRNRVYIHLYLTPVQSAQAASHPVRRPQNAAAA